MATKGGNDSAAAKNAAMAIFLRREKVRGPSVGEEVITMADAAEAAAT